MFFRSWEDLPEFMKNDSVRAYYQILYKKRYKLIIKRMFDITLAILLLIILTPLFILLSIIIKLDSKGPIFFRQIRATQYGRQFKIFKFRTMVDKADMPQTKVTLNADPRITSVGKILRKYRLDEIPQLFNIILGDMSFVGTRPEVMEYIKRYTDEMAVTLLLPAGVTSDASIFNKNEDVFFKDANYIDDFYCEVILPEKMKINLKEISRFSLLNDIRTLFRTVLALFRRETKASYIDDIKRKKIALLTNHMDDIYCFRKELLECLYEDNYNILICCPQGDKYELLNDIKFEYIDIAIDRRGTNILKDLRLLINYYRILKKYKPDIVLSYTIKPNIYGSLVASWLGIPYINNITGFGSVTKKKSIMMSFVLRLLKRALKKSSCVFFQNADNMNFAIENKIISNKNILIPGSGVNTERFILQPYPDDNVIVFNFIGRVLKEKGIDDYIDAAKIIKKVYSNTEFNVIGFIEPTQIYYSKYFEELEKQGIIKYRGNQRDIREYIARSHCTIHPSTYGEGMSNVLLESASSGRPVITTDIPGCRETLDDKITGFMYQAGDVDDLVKKIEKFLLMDNKCRQAMGELGRERIKRLFSRNIVIDAYKKKIGELI